MEAIVIVFLFFSILIQLSIWSMLRELDVRKSFLQEQKYDARYSDSAEPSYYYRDPEYMEYMKNHKEG